MPYKYNESRRHKIEKSRYKVTNWHDYNNGLRRRGDITIWFTKAAIAEWRPTMTGARGRPQEYSDIAIETVLFIRVIVDSTGLKVYGKDEWHQEKHDVPARRTWRKLHLAVDENHQLLACELTILEVGDPTAVPDLLAQIDTPFKILMGDGAYDGEPVSRAILNQQPDAQVIIPPHKTAVRSAAGDTQRDGHIRVTNQHGRIAWQKKTGYGLRNYAELAVQRYKRIFGSILKARKLTQQKAEAWVSAVALNRMTGLGMPVSVKI